MDEQYQRRFEKRKSTGADHSRGYEGSELSRGARAYTKIARAGSERVVSLTRLDALLSKDLLALARLTPPAFGTLGAAVRVTPKRKPKGA
jgi:hypothetical protein